ncbi:MAG: hypothetical protein KDE56_18735 [Anaerolineales bacterium]|nr:hypothetical protein [Anaerolineales bacterium]
MSDAFTNYERGLAELLKRLGDQHPRFGEALVYQHRLQENMSQARRYGDTESRRAGRAEIVDGLNRLALAEVGVSFNGLCVEGGEGETAVSPSTTSPANSTTYNVTISGGQGITIGDSPQVTTHFAGSTRDPAAPQAQATPQRGAERLQLTSELYREIRTVLLDCGPFDSDADVRAIFVLSDLQPFRNSLPSGSSRANRVDLVIAYLQNKYHSNYQNALVLFLWALVDTIPEVDACHHRLKDVAERLTEMGQESWS